MIIFLFASEINGQWLQQTFPFSDALNMVRFADSSTGWIVGWGNIYKTTDSGNSWIAQDSSGGTGTPGISQAAYIFTASKQVTLAKQRN